MWHVETEGKLSVSTNKDQTAIAKQLTFPFKHSFLQP